MFISRLSLKNFRNENDGNIDFINGINMICGQNAAGKTNLLEAIFMFAAGKSFRGCRDREMIKFGFDSADADIEFYDAAGKKNFAVKINKNAHREIYREGIRLTKMSEFLGVFRAVIFTPDHLNLIKGSPECRRRFMDMAICQSYPRYVAAVNEYNRILNQKNAVLKSSESDNMLLDVYDERMAVIAGVITQNRKKFLNMLSEAIKPFHDDMTSGAETVTFNYKTDAGECDTADEITDAYRNIWRQKRDSEIYKGITLYGPHKDDFVVLINGKAAKNYASQGQQRSAVISMKLAEGKLSADLTSEYPVFLLDDVLSELDDGRKKFILSRISAGQVLITGCEKNAFDTLGKGRLIKVEDGNICICT